LSASSSSKTSWLRAALLAPLGIVAMLPVAGESGHAYVPEITVERGRTPSGWNAARSASSANLELRNDWI